MTIAPTPEVTPAATTRAVLSGFFLLGLLLAFLGAIVPTWGYHLSSDYLEVGNYFLSLVGGILLSVPVGERFLKRGQLRLPLVLTASLAAGSLFFLAAFGPPWPAPFRMAGLAACGFSAGLLHSGLFTAISPIYRRDPAATVNLSGLMFGLGALTTALFVASTFYVYKSSAILFFLGVIPALLAGQFARMRMPPVDERPPGRDMSTGFQGPAAYLFSLLLFFQFGNEWAIAGWLPLFLVQRLGISPSTSLLLLALYWLALILGRFAVLAILPTISHSRLLLASVVSAMLGCIILTFTNNLFGASVALILVGGGFASIYPLVVEKIGGRFQYYHPGHFNGFFSFAVTGGLLAPASLGYFAHWMGIGVIMGLPLVGSIAVVLLLILIWLETKLHQSTGVLQ
ncbi:MAG: MFS transporter [Bryobacterales bacterium]|nr:MFS transporter [Bryobacterales bacterium]